MGNTRVTKISDTVVNENQPTTNFDKMARLFVRTGGLGDAYIYLWFSIPAPAGSTLTSGGAKLSFYTEAIPGTGSHTFTLRRPNKTVSFTKVTWKTRPTTYFTGTKTVTKVGNVADKTLWEVDLTDWVQQVVDGQAWYGVELRLNDATIRRVYGTLTAAATYRPFVDFAWSDAPEKPLKLAPSAGRVISVAKPVLRFDYVDVAGSVTLANVQVQINPTNSFTTPAFDSGAVATPYPELDLNTTAYAGLADGDTAFWRVRVQDAAGLWSEWSDPTSFTRDIKGTLLIDNPPPYATMSDGQSRVVEGHTIPPKGLREFLTLTPDPAIKNRGFQAAAMDLVTRDIYASQVQDNNPADNLWISRFASSNAYAYADKMYLPVGGHAGKVYVDHEVNTTYVTFEYAGSQTPTAEAPAVPKSWVRLPYIAGKTWTSSEALAYSIPTPVFNGTKNPANGWYQSEVSFEGVHYRLTGSPSTTTPYIPAYMDIIKDKVIVSTVDLSTMGFINMDKSGQPIGGRVEAEGISVFTIDDYPHLMIGALVNTAGSAAGYKLMLYSYALPSKDVGIDPNEPAFDVNTASYVTDPTPLVAWTFSGETQKSFQVILSEFSSPEVPTKVLWTSPKTTGTDNSMSIPAGFINQTGKMYRVTVRIWDGKSREAIPGDPVYTELHRDFTYIYSSTVSTVTTLHAQSNDPVPTVTLRWSIPTAPDAFNIVCNGVIVAANLDPADYNTTSTEYEWTHANPDPRTQLNYSVVPVVNGKSATKNIVSIAKVSPLGTWLRSADGSNNVRIVNNTDRKMGYGEQSDTLQVIGATEPILVTQGMQGYSGTVTGELRNSEDTSVEEFRDNFLKIKSNPGQTLKLTLGDMALDVIAYNMDIYPLPTPELAYAVSFDWFQTGTLRFSPKL